ncbi:MAG: D-TA family PLP-dependent enzyme [Chloroflexi bacterium]|nr:D-TA family PLP-dependent enzyme [Chloroflexota bacterium]
MHISELDTPVVIIDLDRLEANIARLQSYLDAHQILNRPHIKTHKIPQIAQMQLQAGATGITCQKLGEAEVMAQAGTKDIFIPYNLMGDKKLERLAILMKMAQISVTADSEYTARGLARAAQQASNELTVLVEFDTGSGRCGVQNPQQAADLACVIADMPSLKFGGLMTYPANQNTALFIQETKTLLEKRGIPVERVSLGGTPKMWEAHTHTGVTEYRAGTYVYGDRATLKAGAMTVNQCAMHIVSTVISRPNAERGILDAGSKTLSSDLLGLTGHGLILEYPEAQIHQLSEEHGHVDFSGCINRPQIGERVTIIPNHCCVVSNLFNQMVGVRGDQVEVVWDVAARGLLT